MFMMSSAAKLIIATHILSNILRSKGTHAAKFGHLIKYSVRNIFVEKLVLNHYVKNQN